MIMDWQRFGGLLGYFGTSACDQFGCGVDFLDLDLYLRRPRAVLPIRYGTSDFVLNRSSGPWCPPRLARHLRAGSDELRHGGFSQLAPGYQGTDLQPGGIERVLLRAWVRRPNSETFRVQRSEPIWRALSARAGIRGHRLPNGF